MINKKISHSVSFLLIFSISNLSLIGTTFANPSIKTVMSIGEELNTLFKKVNSNDTKNLRKLLERYPEQPLKSFLKRDIYNLTKKDKGYETVGYGTFLTIPSAGGGGIYLCLATQCLVNKGYNKCDKSSPSLTQCLSKPLKPLTLSKPLMLSKPLTLRNGTLINQNPILK